MIGTVTLNPCMDRTVEIDGFVYGGMNRIKKVRRDISGKGINVALALVQNEIPAIPCGFLYAENSKSFLADVESLGLTYQGVAVAGSLRENIKVLDASKHVTTELNQSGYPVSDQDVHAFIDFFRSFISRVSCVVLSGSVPANVPYDIYRTLVEVSRSANVPCILDAEGALLLEGLRANPYLIKPNLFEFQTAFGVECSEPDTIRDVAKKIISGGSVDIVCVTMGKTGALIVGKDESYFSPALPVDVQSTQGAGDSVVAGFCMAIEQKKGLRDMLRYGCAMSHGSITREGTLMCRKEDFDRYLNQVEVVEL